MMAYSMAYNGVTLSMFFMQLHRNRAFSQSKLTFSKCYFIIIFTWVPHRYLPWPRGIKKRIITNILCLLLNKAPCQGKTCQFMLYTRADKTCQGETCQGQLVKESLSCVWGFNVKHLSALCYSNSHKYELNFHLSFI